MHSSPVSVINESNVDLRELRSSGAIRRYTEKINTEVNKSKQIYNGGRGTCLQNRDLILF